ncbi:hypothetical protein AMTR_s00038p00069390 [Amborella trichopoda]|uniref:Aminotransferase-like plant mobile domain-containing protein n=1 Tax=Amborella trichopoda TaxID=13333 RepID=U5CWL9_AMBTC|nr:hypothetical protein AMTR_s00038p00069390 [Amborella trichopoda]
MNLIHPDGGYPGGPQDPGEQVIRIDKKSFQLKDWHLTDEQVELVNAFGLGTLSIIRSGRIDHALVSTNVKRWRSGTNTFHYNIQIGNLTVLKHSWLKDNFRELSPDPTLVEVVRYTRAYLLFLISITIFADASRYLQFFEDIEEAGKYVWGAAALAFLYRSLGKACTFKRRHFSGSTTLMQADEVISYDRKQVFETAMCITMLIFDDIIESYMPDQVRWQFGAKQGIPINPLSVGKKSSRQGRQQDWQTVNADKIQRWLTRHNRMMANIEVDTANGLPSKGYKAWHNLVSHPIIHNVANPLKDILQPHNQEEDVVSAVQSTAVMLVEALTLRQKWNAKVSNRVNNAFETLTKFVPVDMDNIEAMMENLQCEINGEGVPEERGHDVVSESSRAAEDLAPSTQLAVEEPKRYNI